MISMTSFDPVLGLLLSLSVRKGIAIAMTAASCRGVCVYGTSLRLLMLTGGYCTFRKYEAQVAAVVSTCYELDGDTPYLTRKMTLMALSSNI
jgi:hypothetical protein